MGCYAAGERPALSHQLELMRFLLLLHLLLLLLLLLHLSNFQLTKTRPATDKPIMMKLLKTQSVGIIVEVRHFACSAQRCSSLKAARVVYYHFLLRLHCT